MTEPTDIPSRYRSPGPAARWSVRLLALAAAGLSMVLFYQALASETSLPGCGAGSGCDAVLASQWSRWLGVPVSLPAIVVYAAIFAASLHIGQSASIPRQRRAWMAMLWLSTLAAAAAVWFTVVQVAFIGELCRYCTVVHVCGLVLAAVVWLIGPVGRRRILPDEPADPMLIAPFAAGGLAASAALIFAAFTAGQVVWPSPTTHIDRIIGGRTFDTGPGPDRQLTLLDGAVHVSPHSFPALGSPDAPVVIAELYDYTCPHCRHLHELLNAARQRYGDQLVILPLATPLDGDCNQLVQHTEPRHETACELARLAMAVWRAQPGAFEVMHDWLFTGELPPTVDAARAYAAGLVGDDALAAALADPWVQQQIQRNIKLYAMTGGSLPQLLAPKAVIRGRPPTPTELFTLLEAETPLQSPRP